MRSLKILTLVAVLLLVGTVGAMAQSNRDQIVRVNMPNVAEGTLYLRSSLIPRVEGPPVSLPTPVDPSSAESLTLNGPVANSPVPMASAPKGMSDSIGFGSGALATPRGSAFSSPKARADREIRRLIRRLD